MHIAAPPDPTRWRTGSGLMLVRTATCVVAGIVGSSIFAAFADGGQITVGVMIRQMLAIVMLLTASIWLARREDEQNSDRAERILAFISLDALTGILNRSFFVDRIRAEDEGGALLIIDADRFKAINDSYGHYSGDIALVRIANAIDAATPKPGFVGRLGGEEFGVFMPKIGLSQARNIAESIRKAVEVLDFSVAGTAVPLSVSVGVSLHNAEDPVRVAFTQADENLYAAKRGGRNRVAIAPTPVHELQRRIGIAG